MGKVTLVRNFDKLVFGNVRNVTEKALKNYRINNGEVQIKFKNKWAGIEEHAENDDMYSIPWVSISDWSIYY